jgi:hypothetical protein
MYTQICIPVFATISGCVFYFKKNKTNENNVHDEDIEFVESELDADCPVIFFDNNGNYYYVYK